MVFVCFCSTTQSAFWVVPHVWTDLFSEITFRNHPRRRCGCSGRTAARNMASLKTYGPHDVSRDPNTELDFSFWISLEIRIVASKCVTPHFSSTSFTEKMMPVDFHTFFGCLNHQRVCFLVGVVGWPLPFETSQYESTQSRQDELTGTLQPSDFQVHSTYTPYAKSVNIKLTKLLVKYPLVN